MTVRNATNVGNALGKLVMIKEDPIFGVAWGNYIRLKLELDVTQPLQQGFLMPRRGKTDTWIALKYKRLSDFYYACGRLGHLHILCPHTENPSTKLVYGPWMRFEYIHTTHFQDIQQIHGSQVQESQKPKENNQEMHLGDKKSKGKEILIYDEARNNT